MLQILAKIWSWLLGRKRPEPPVAPPAEAVQRVVLMSEVQRTLFDDFSRHRATQRGDEEIGWLLLGVRAGDAIEVHATLPAGEFREAGVAHVQFNCDAQALASRIVRQNAKHLQIVGVVHTHPGILRHPSSGDFHGDREWVRRLRAQEAVFAIGTADVRRNESPACNQQIEDDLTFHWFALATGDGDYRPLVVECREGSDLAKPLHPHWPTIETHAKPLENLCLQMARVSFHVASQSLHVRIGRPQPGDSILLVLAESEPTCYVQQSGELFQVDLDEPLLDRAVYLLMAELAKKREPASALMSR